MPHQIIACIDGSITSVSVCDWASWVSDRLQKPLTLLHALDNTSQIAKPNLTGNIGLGSCEKLMVKLTTLDEQRNKKAFQQGKQLLDDAHQRVVANGIKEAHCLQRHGNLIDVLHEIEKETAFLVIGRQGKKSGKENGKIGSQLEAILHTMHYPILVALPEFKQPKKIMFAFDGSKTAQKVVDSIIKNYQLLQGLTLHLVMVNKKNHETTYRAAQALLKETGINVISALLDGPVESTLANYVKEQAIDLLIMGAYGHSRIRQFFVGSTTTHMLQKTQIPLLLIR